MTQLLFRSITEWYSKLQEKSLDSLHGISLHFDELEGYREAKTSQAEYLSFCHYVIEEASSKRVDFRKEFANTQVLVRIVLPDCKTLSFWDETLLLEINQSLEPPEVKLLSNNFSFRVHLEEYTKPVSIPSLTHLPTIFRCARYESVWDDGYDFSRSLYVSPTLIT